MTGAHLLHRPGARRALRLEVGDWVDLTSSIRHGARDAAHDRLERSLRDQLWEQLYLPLRLRVIDPERRT